MREDTGTMATMEALGWKAVMDPRDVQMGRQSNPNHPYSFEKGNMHIWMAIKRKEYEIGWRYAELIDGHYCNHKWITIEEACKL